MCKALVDLTCCSANSSRIFTYRKTASAGTGRRRTKEEAAGEGAAGGGEKERGEPWHGARGGDRVRDGGACDLRPKLHHLQEDLWDVQGQKCFQRSTVTFQNYKNNVFGNSSAKLCLIWDLIKWGCAKWRYIYRMDEIKSLSFHIMFYRLYHGAVKYIVSGNTFSPFEWQRSFYAAHNGAWRRDTTRSSLLNEDYICSMLTRFKHYSSKTTDFKPLKLKQQSCMRARLFLCEKRAFSFSPTLNNYINTLICIRIPVFASILINTVI